MNPNVNFTGVFEAGYINTHYFSLFQFLRLQILLYIDFSKALIDPSSTLDELLKISSIYACRLSSFPVLFITINLRSSRIIIPFPYENYNQPINALYLNDNYRNKLDDG